MLERLADALQAIARSNSDLHDFERAECLEAAEALRLAAATEQLQTAEPCDRNAVIEECLSKLHAVVAAIGLDMTGGATISFAKLIDLLNEVRDSLRALKTQPTERAEAKGGENG